MIQTYWKEFITKTKRETNEKCAGVICFGMDAQTCASANEKILSGKMRCRIYPAEGYKRAMSGEAQIGELNIVTDWQGAPIAIIETTRVHVLPVNELTDEICACEAICPDLASWKDEQMPFLKTEVEELGEVFNDATLLTIEEFRTVYPIA